MYDVIWDLTKRMNEKYLNASVELEQFIGPLKQLWKISLADSVDVL